MAMDKWADRDPRPPMAGGRVNGRPFKVMVVTLVVTVRAYAYLGQYLFPRTMRSMLVDVNVFTWVNVSGFSDGIYGI